MPSYPLSERQKNLLRSIAPGLRDGTVATEWRLLIPLDGSFKVFGVNRKGETWQQNWTGKASRADFDVLVQCGFLISRDKDHYSLVEQAIIDAVESNFGIAEPDVMAANAERAEIERLQVENLSLKAKLDEMRNVAQVNPYWRGRDFEIESDLCFLLMPFSAQWSNAVWQIIRGIVTDCGLRCERADEKDGRVVMEDVWEGICKARVIIADLTAKNPNVAYEVGLADVLGKEVIFLSQTPNDVPFDFLGQRLITYENSIDGAQKLTENLGKRLRKIANPK